MSFGAAYFLTSVSTSKPAGCFQEVLDPDDSQADTAFAGRRRRPESGSRFDKPILPAGDRKLLRTHNCKNS